MNPKKSKNGMKNNLEYNAYFVYICLFSTEYKVRGFPWPETQTTTENKLFIKPYRWEIKTNLQQYKWAR